MGLRWLTLVVVLLVGILSGPAVVSAEDDAVSANTIIAGHSEILNLRPEFPPAELSESALRELLGDAKYQDQAWSKPPGETWLEKFVKWLINLLSRTGLPVNSNLGLIVVITLGVLLIALIIKLIWNLLGRRGFTASQQPGTADEADLTADGLRKAAATAANRGNLREALRLRFLAVLSEAELPYSSLMTNSQVKRLIRRDHPAVAKPFGNLVLAYENAWYGGQELTLSGYSSASDLAITIEGAIGGDD